MGPFRATPLGLRESPELPSQAPGNPLYDPLWSSPVYIRAHSLSTTLQGRVSPITRKGLSLLPPVVRRHQHLHLGVSCGHRNVPHTSHCTSKATMDSSGLRRSPSRTLRRYAMYSSHRCRNRQTITPIHALLASYGNQYTTMCQIRITNTLHSNYPNITSISGTHIFEHFYNAFLSHFINTSCYFKNLRPTPRLHLPPQEATTSQAPISHNDTRNC